MLSTPPLSSNKLYQCCDPSLFNFKTTADLEDYHEFIGQPRAVEAVNFGIGIQQSGYNIFAFGPTGTGKKSLILKVFSERAASEAVPDDWCYVFNFSQTDKPKALRLPAGKGNDLQKDMTAFVDELKTTLSAAFESDEYQTRKQALEAETQERQEKEFDVLQETAKKSNLALLRTPGGLVFAPVKDGEVLPPEEFRKLPADVREEMEKRVEELQKILQELLQKIQVWQRESHQKVRKLDNEMTSAAVGGLLKELLQKYQIFPDVMKYLEDVQKDILENASKIIPTEENPDAPSEQSLAALMTGRRSDISFLKRYQVNVLINHQTTQGAPVVYEDNPTYQNLFGRTEQIAQMGALLTDFTLIKPGSVHLANGGYLVIDARKLFSQSFAWDALKRALQSHKVGIESIGQMLGLISTTSLEPEPIELDIKVALLGDRAFYYLLSEVDPEFRELFKVRADFAEEVERNPENQLLYARMIATLGRMNGIMPFERSAVSRVIEYSARFAGDSERLSIQVNDIIDLMNESDYWAKQNFHQIIENSDIQQAIEARIYRSDRIRERYQDNILRENIMISTQGEQVGQINGLSIVQLGDYSFGFPSRITAKVRLGKGDVINIEREVDLSGPIHSKGVLILSSFLGGHYATKIPLAITASLVFEQSYSGVEGDSASAGELIVLLSAISNIPIKQNLAITGSVNQHGQIQPIGGVNEKIEGFFDICKARGLTGEQGVIIPSSNVKNLMLRQDVIDAVSAGKFAIYAIEKIDQGIELLTGYPAGEQDEDGEYPQGSFNAQLMERLRIFTELSEAQEKEKKADAGSAESKVSDKEAEDGTGK